MKQRENGSQGNALISPGWLTRFLFLFPASTLFTIIVWVSSRVREDRAIWFTKFLSSPFVLYLHHHRKLNIRKLFEHADWNVAQCKKLNTHYVNYHARFLTEVVRARSTSDEDLRRRVLFDGEEDLRAALQKGNGAILVATHMGNWYYTVFILAIYGYPVSCLHYRSPIRSFNSYNEAIAKRFNVDLIHVGGGAPRRVRNALENNRIVIIFFEVSVRPTHNVWLPFGNCALPIDLGSAKIALLNKTPILRIRSVGLDDGRTRVTVGPEIDVPPSSGQRQAADLMDIWLRNLSSEVLQHPEQWWPLGYITIGSSSKTSTSAMRGRTAIGIAPE